jgi:hypothetical protein
MLDLLVKFRLSEIFERAQHLKSLKKSHLPLAELLSNLPISPTGLGIGLGVAAGLGAAAGLVLLVQKQSSPKTTRRGTRAKSGRANVLTPKIDNVHFKASSPPAVQPGQTIMVDVWAHTERQRAEVARRIQQASSPSDSPPVIRSKGPSRIQRGTILLVRLSFPEFHVGSPEDIICWEGEIATASFAVAVPTEIVEGMKTGSVTAHSEGGLRIAEVLLPIKVAANSVSTAAKTQSFHDYRKGFASYASQDRDEVLGRIQGMQKVKPDLHVYVDVIELRSRDDWEEKLQQVIPQNDVFFLFWSAAAKKSSHVEREWRYALDCRGIGFIDPVPLVSPEEVPPPKELGTIHFNDRILAFLKHRPTSPSS